MAFFAGMRLSENRSPAEPMSCAGFRIRDFNASVCPSRTNLP